MLALVMLIPLTIFCKIFQFNVLPSKYFYDSSKECFQCQLEVILWKLGEMLMKLFQNFLKN